MGLRLQNMREKKRKDGVKVCPQVAISEIEYLEGESTNGGEDQENMAAMVQRLIKEARRGKSDKVEGMTNEMITLAKQLQRQN